MEELIYRQKYHVREPTTYERIVHLDLKGAPPKMSYLLQLLPTLKDWGVTGLLVEYEDTFPYGEELEVLQKKEESYTIAEIQELQKLAAELNLEFVPLIQTFGHLEQTLASTAYTIRGTRLTLVQFVLKHPKFIHLSEDQTSAFSLCPSLEDSLTVVKLMIDQVVVLHPSIKFLHIGADEVMPLGTCPRCQERMKELKLTPSDIFLTHVTRITDFISQKYPGVRLIMWDDMLRKIDGEKMKAKRKIQVTLREYHLNSYVEPMVWIYGSSMEFFKQNIPTDVWNVYSEIFSKFWIASAFKGAFGPSLYHVPIGHHILNHMCWQLMLCSSIPSNLQFQGIVFTGWQRYAHHSVLCELLPAGLPSLLFCLSTFIKGLFSQEDHQKLSQILGFDHRISLHLQNAEKIDRSFLEAKKLLPGFPGQDIFLLIEKLAHVEFSLEGQLALRDRGSKENVLTALEGMRLMANETLSGIYKPHTVKEWTSLRIETLVRILKVGDHH